MRLCTATAQLVEWGPNSALQHIETCGRICYKSEKTETSANGFVKMLKERGHFAMMEHVNFVFEVDDVLYNRLHAYFDIIPADYNEEHESWGAKHLSFTSIYHEETGCNRYLVSGNVRAINNTRCYELITTLMEVYPELVWKDPHNPPTPACPCRLVPSVWSLPYLKEVEIRAHCYLTFILETDRGVTHELVRHREASYAHESTRYCNYSKDKFGNEIRCKEPHKFNMWTSEQDEVLQDAFKHCEESYMKLLELGCAPQQARAVLPFGIMSTIAMTTNVEEYLHFFALRYLGLTGAPHPDMHEVAAKMFDQYKEYMYRELGVAGVDYRQCRLLML